MEIGIPTFYLFHQINGSISEYNNTKNKDKANANR